MRIAETISASAARLNAQMHCDVILTTHICPLSRSAILLIFRLNNTKKRAQQIDVEVDSNTMFDQGPIHHSTNSLIRRILSCTRRPIHAHSFL
jgi:CBS domain containing-hemolysin-like protein